ncbi:MAG: 50S ribosomal protein L30 [Deltaproteobacteria bacterium]|nr:50S ribosomal protein L30 [Deltaproteobacteria bacterium]
MGKQIEIELVRSINGTPRWMRTVVRTLGLRRLHHRRLMPDNNAVRGMIKRVSHLVALRERES